jgi:hypothetical protein
MYFVLEKTMKRVHYISVLFLCCLVSACNLFETRTPEKPTTGSSKFIPPTSPDIVLMNLQSAVSDLNTENYMRCLVDTLNASQRFQFVPTTVAAGRYPTVFAAWSLQSERSYFSSIRVLATGATQSGLLFNGSFTVIASDSAVYNGDYTLTIPHGVTGVSETVRGNVQFTLSLNRNSFWNISRWVDNPISGEASWSEWKGRFAN